MKNPFEIPDKPFVLSFDGWDNWHAEAKRRYPIRFFLSETLPTAVSQAWRRFVHDPWYRLRCRAWHRYNVVYIRTLPPTWMDRDEVMLHAAFQILADFVEREEPSEFSETWQEHHDTYAQADPDWVPGTIVPHAQERADDAQKLKDLYYWWKGRRTVTMRTRTKIRRCCTS